MDLEFIVALNEHRSLGYIFMPYLIKNAGAFYTVVSVVHSNELEEFGYHFSAEEIEIVKLTEKYSDENLARKFSRSVNVQAFYDGLKPEYFEKHVSPFLDKYLFQCAVILMKSNIRLFRKKPKYGNLYNDEEVKVNRSFAEAVFTFERLDYETRYTLRILQDGREMSMLHKKINVVAQEPCVLDYEKQLFIFENLNAKRLTPFFNKEFVAVPASMEDKYYSTFVLNAIKNNKVRSKGFSIIDAEAIRRVVLSLEQNLNNEPAFVLQFCYGESIFLPNAQRMISVTYKKENGQVVFLKVSRDKKWEQQVERMLGREGLVEKNGFYFMVGTDAPENSSALYSLVNWVNKHHKKLEDSGIEIKQDKFAKKFFTGGYELKVEVTGVSDWFDIYAMVHFGEYKIPFIKLKKHILNGIREFNLPDGETAVLPEEWFTEYRDLLPFAHADGERIKLSKHHFPVLTNSLPGIRQDLKNQIEQFSNMTKLQVLLPPALKARLRPYQVTGYSWLYQLYENGFGGCLADDMGLGKTLQTLALLLKLKRESKTVAARGFTGDAGQLNLFNGPADVETQPASLIILPTSLVHNWENEIKKFAPSLKTYKYVGINRRHSMDLRETVKFYDVILTTYGTVRNDSETLSRIDFFYLILDESQYIKNPSSQTYKAVLKLKAQNRLVLTGTPVENSLMDLWSQMNFLNHGLLGSNLFFRQHFILPVEKKNDLETGEKLQRMIHPFILRRKKEEVANDLPPLMEQVRYCNMEKGQKIIYEKEKSAIRKIILENIENVGYEKSSFIVLQGLTKLRQLANHPALVDKEYNSGSGKYNEIFESLEGIVKGMHKVLVFSSFVKHLELLREGLEIKGWKYGMLTGQTREREKEIKRFQENEAVRIFLVSLKAGGVGLNLVEADYVFIVDPWWNPASELQAINRSHRIGQEKHVFVYRFITENSIEQKIQKLQIKKSLLAEKFVNSNNPFKVIPQDDLIGLFR